MKIFDRSKKGGFIILLVLVCSLKTSGQPMNKQNDKSHSPNLATWLSVGLPGAGQMYNRQIWKLPFIYGLMGTTIYYAIENHKDYKDLDRAFDMRTNLMEDEPFLDDFANLSTTSLERLINDRRNRRDLNILLTAGLYGLQILDAYVAAQLFEFDISDDLTATYQPLLISIPYTSLPQIGLGLTLQIK